MRSILRKFAYAVPPSAKRMNVNSRGCQAKETGTKKPIDPERVKLGVFVRPFQGREGFGRAFRGFHPRLFMLFASGELAPAVLGYRSFSTLRISDFAIRLSPHAGH